MSFHFCHILCVECLFTMMWVPTNGLFDYSKGRKVTLVPKLMEWSEAALECEQMNGTLLTITDTATMYDLDIEGRWIIWVGIKTNGTSSAWHSGVPVSWTNWIPSTQSPESSTVPHCTSIETTSPFWWTKQNCSSKLPSLCETYTGNVCDFKVQQESSLIGFSRTFYNEVNLATCQNTCITIPEFNCQSFEYNSLRSLCQLSDTNRWEHQSKFTTNDPEWDHYHMDCYFADVNDSLIPNGWEPTTVPTTEATTERFCFTAEELLPTENETKEIETVIHELQELETKYKGKRRSMAKESTSDDRPSATYVGTIAMVIVASLLGAVVVLDLLTATRHCCKNKKKKKRGNLQINKLAHARSVLAERRFILSSATSSGTSINTNTNTDTSNSLHSPIEIEDVQIHIRRPILQATANNKHDDNSNSATLPINRIASFKDKNSSVKEPVCLNTEIEIDTVHTTFNMRDRDDYSCLNAAYVNTSPVLSPFHRANSEKTKGAGFRKVGRSSSFEQRKGQNSHTSEQGNDNTPSYSTFGSVDFTLWPYHSVDRYYRRNTKYGHEKFILAYGSSSAFQKDEEVESFKC